MIQNWRERVKRKDPDGLNDNYVKFYSAMADENN